jgi:uncharacterized protein (DUF305 family)
MERMTQSIRRWVAASLSLITAATACRAATQAPVRASAVPRLVDQAHLDPAARSRADSGRAPYTRADVNFMSGMIGHHAQAVVMAGWAPSHGASQSVRALCERIVVAQTDEIALMQRWLRERRETVPAADPKGLKMTMNGVEHVMLMPGMLSEAQMTELDQSRGTDFDRLFLTYMIQHHLGAITMVNDLFGSSGAGQDEVVFKFASDVYADQSTEIDRMTKMLSALTPAARNP